MDRRDPDRGCTRIACRTCGFHLVIDPAMLRLTATHASLRCPACERAITVRRADAYRDIDPTIAWLFAAYRSQADEQPEPAVAAITRLLGRLQDRAGATFRTSGSGDAGTLDVHPRHGDSGGGADHPAPPPRRRAHAPRGRATVWLPGAFVAATAVTVIVLRAFG